MKITEKKQTRAHARTPKGKPAEKAPPRKLATTATRPAGQSRSGTKQDKVMTMLQSKAGTTIPAIMKVTGWQPHSVRGFLSGYVRSKLGLTVVSEKDPGTERIYRIVTGKPARRGVRPAKGKK